jgi:hypothetical protein
MTMNEFRSTEIVGWRHDKPLNVWLLIGVHGRIMGFSKSSPAWGITARAPFKHLMRQIPGGPLHESE